MAPDQSDYKIQNAPLLTPEQRTMLSFLLGGYQNMMQGTTFGQAYPGATSSGYQPKTFKGPIMKYTEAGKKIIDKDAGKKYRKKNGDNGDGDDDGHEEDVTTPGEPGSSYKGGKIGTGGKSAPREVLRVVNRGQLTPRSPLDPLRPVLPAAAVLRILRGY